MEERNPYSVLPETGPYEVAIGAALITMVEPHPGHEQAYNRWYEDDHFYAGAMAMPWMFAGRRWVATRDLQALRFPEKSPVADPVTAGCYITVYWITEGRYRDHLRWTVATNKRLFPDGRVFAERTHVFTSFQQRVSTIHRDASGPRDIHALDFPYQGLVLEVIDANDSDARTELAHWLESDFIPAKQADAGSHVAISLVFEPFPLPPKAPSYVKPVAEVDRRMTVLHFLEEDPRECWSSFTGDAEAVSATGLGSVSLAAPFVPTLPGTDRYVEQLR